MPSEKILQQKQQQVAELAEKLNGSVAGVIVDYKGINVENDTKLRKELREAGVEYAVIKNSILRMAAEKAGLDGVLPSLVGSTALAVSGEDYVAAARILCKYAEKSKGAFTVKCGFIDGNAIDAKEVTDLAKLPSREVLVAMVLGGLNAPISGLVGVLNANLRGLAVALNAIAEQKSA